MPKVHDTRKQKAAELMRLVTKGPSLSHSGFVDDPYTPQMAMESCKCWLESWVTPLVKELVPELRKKKGGAGG